MTTETKAERIKSMMDSVTDEHTTDIFALWMVSKNIKERLENYELKKKTIKLDIEMFKMEDRQALKKMNEDDNDKEYIHYLERQQNKLLKIIENFIDKM